MSLAFALSDEVEKAQERQGAGESKHQAQRAVGLERPVAQEGLEDDETGPPDVSGKAANQARRAINVTRFEGQANDAQPAIEGVEQGLVGIGMAGKHVE